MDMKRLQTQIARTLRRRFLAGLITGVLACGVLQSCCGCNMDAMKTMFSYNHETGEAKTELKGAKAGGVFNENKGLNLSLGDNTATVVIVGLILLALGAGVAAYKSMPTAVLKESKDETPKP